MHPIERLRWVARSSGDDSAELAREAAEALAIFDDEPAGLVTACRRLLQRHPRNAALWWLASRVLESSEPGAEAWSAASELAADDTEEAVAGAIPDEAEVLVVGWPATLARALVRRGDVRVLLGDTGDGVAFARALGRAGVDVELLAGHAIGAAAARVDLVLIEVEAMSERGIVAAIGSRPAAAVARPAGIPVWGVVPLGHALPAPLWSELAAELAASRMPWREDDELIPLDLVSSVVASTGLMSVAELLAGPLCPVAPELLKPLAD